MNEVFLIIKYDDFYHSPFSQVIDFALTFDEASNKQIRYTELNDLYIKHDEDICKIQDEWENANPVQYTDDDHDSDENVAILIAWVGENHAYMQRYFDSAKLGNFSDFGEHGKGVRYSIQQVIRR